MRRAIPCVLRDTLPLFLAAMGTTGCQVSGTWTVAEVDPPGAGFPLQQLVLDPNRNYSALWTEDGEKKGSYGQYRWNGYQLKVAQAGRDPRTYGARLGLDGKLRMTYREDDQSVTALLTRRPASAPQAEAPATAPTALEAGRSQSNDLPSPPPRNAAGRPTQPR